MLRLIAVIVGAWILAWWLAKDDSTIKCFVVNVDKQLVVEALQAWNVENLKVQFVEKREECDLYIISTYFPESLYGKQKHQTIKLNKRYKLSKAEQIKVLTHEFGHYFLIEHSDEPGSIMNSTLYLNTAHVTQKDKASAKYFIKFLKLTKTIYWFLDLFSNNVDFNHK